MFGRSCFVLHALLFDRRCLVSFLYTRYFSSGMKVFMNKKMENNINMHYWFVFLLSFLGVPETGFVDVILERGKQGSAAFFNILSSSFH